MNERYVLTFQKQYFFQLTIVSLISDEISVIIILLNPYVYVVKLGYEMSPKDCDKGWVLHLWHFYERIDTLRCRIEKWGHWRYHVGENITASVLSVSLFASWSLQGDQSSSMCSFHDIPLCCHRPKAIMDWHLWNDWWKQTLLENCLSWLLCHSDRGYQTQEH